MIELTPEQQQALSGGTGGPLRILDPRTGTVYVLVPEETYGEIRSLLEPDELDPRVTYPAVDAVFREDWDNPQMAEYDRYEEHKR
jgi:hypothetical protein